MKKVTNPTDADIIGYRVNGTDYTILAGQSIGPVDDLVGIWLHNQINFLVCEPWEPDTIKVENKPEPTQEVLSSLTNEPQENPSPSTGTSISTVKGLGPASIEKLNQAGFYMVEQIQKLEKYELQKVLGPILGSRVYNELQNRG